MGTVWGRCGGGVRHGSTPGSRARAPARVPTRQPRSAPQHSQRTLAGLGAAAADAQVVVAPARPNVPQVQLLRRRCGGCGRSAALGALRVCGRRRVEGRRARSGRERGWESACLSQLTQRKVQRQLLLNKPARAATAQQLALHPHPPLVASVSKKPLVTVSSGQLSSRMMGVGGCSSTAARMVAWARGERGSGGRG